MSTTLAPPPVSQKLSAEEEEEFLQIANQLASMSSIQNQNPSGENSAADTNNNNSASPSVPAHVLPLRRYLESSILPLLTKALEACALAKPNDPLEFLAAYLLSNNPVRQNPLPVPPCGALSGWLSAAAGTRAPALAEEGSI